MSTVKRFRLAAYSSFKHLFINSLIHWGVCLYKSVVGHGLGSQGTTYRSQPAFLPCGHKAQTQAITLELTEQSYCLMVPFSLSPQSISFLNDLRRPVITF